MTDHALLVLIAIGTALLGLIETLIFFILSDLRARIMRLESSEMDRANFSKRLPSVAAAVHRIGATP